MAEQESHKRTKSTLSLLRRNPAKVDDEGASDTGSVGSSSQPTLHPSVSGTSSLSKSPTMAGITKTVSDSGKSGKLPAAAAPDKTLSIEQSVRKFRIFEALRGGDTAQISKSIREASEGANAAGHLEDTTILHLAIQCAELPVVEYVLSDGASAIDINAKDKDGNTPLHLAALQGRGQIVRLLLAQTGINDSIANTSGKLPLDLARTPDIFQQLQLSRSLFVDTKIKEIQLLISGGNYKALSDVLEEPRVKTVLDINGGEFASEISTVQSGGTLLHEAARRKNTELIKVLLLHGADPFRRDRRGKLPQDVTKDEATRAMLKKSPAAVAAQRGIQEKAVLGNLSQTAAGSTGATDALAAKESREMKGYLKKWTNYRKGYQLRWFVLEDGVLSYYKHQDDTGSACRGAINMRIAKLNMDPTEKQKFEIIGKSSVKYSLKANHEVETKRWFWALNNSIQWTKDQAKEEYKQKERVSELLRQAKVEQSERTSRDHSSTSLAPESIAGSDIRRGSMQSVRATPSNEPSRQPSQRVTFKGTSIAGSVQDEDEGTAYGSYEASLVNDATRATSNNANAPFEGEYEDDYGDDTSSRERVPVSKDAFDITAQSAQLQLDMMSQVHTALLSEQSQNPGAIISDTLIRQALSTYDNSIRSLNGLLSDMTKISKDRDDYWQRRLNHEAELRQMWEDSMAQVAREQEVLEARVGESEEKRKRTKRALREVMESTSRPESRGSVHEPGFVEAVEAIDAPDGVPTLMRRGSTKSTLRRKSVLADITTLSDSGSEDDEEFFDAVDAGEIAVGEMPPTSPKAVEAAEEKSMQLTVAGGGVDLTSSFKGYEDGIRKRLKMDADERPKISLWSILRSMIGKDMTKMTLPVSFNEPTSLLQRCAEDMEYTDLLDTAAGRADSTERMVYVAAFAASEYASTIGRVAKPFNPLLGETFEYARPDKEFRFFIEQVSHHPPIGAAWADSPRWTYYGESAVKSKFYGKSFDINPLGTWFLKLRPTNGDKEEFYTWKKVTSSVIGIMTGSPTVDNYGVMEVKNWTTGEVATVDFKPRGWTASSAYNISGRVLDARGKPRFSLGGKWNSKMYARLTPGYEASLEEPKGELHSQDSVLDASQVFLVWQANPRPTGIPFNLTPFVVTLNDINDKLKPYLPPTDTRLRPDQRAMEDGEYAFAATEKNRVEEKQRATRKRREMNGEEFVPHWFKKNKCPITGEEFWDFNGKYWEEREKAGRGESNWEGVERIF
ncbi:hypothetical protein V494_01548 [Pseudogymnoascus sp. VKM F-4513 (FW-928)]|nr:hypothetical protein V494_01548 [Pseudogymnoascus sp. VKM F-4513 (FW-928)]